MIRANGLHASSVSLGPDDEYPRMTRHGPGFAWMEATSNAGACARTASGARVTTIAVAVSQVCVMNERRSHTAKRGEALPVRLRSIGQFHQLIAPLRAFGGGA